MVEVNLNIVERGSKHLQHHPAKKSSQESTEDREKHRRKKRKMRREKKLMTVDNGKTVVRLRKNSHQ